MDGENILGQNHAIVQKIKNGTVIDHIPKNRSYLVEKALKLDASDLSIIIARNIPSTKMGFKDFIKLNYGYITHKRKKRLSLVCPGATINIIKNMIIVKKEIIKLPDPNEDFVGVIQCVDQDCVSFEEPHQVESCFVVVKYKHLPNDLFLRCLYCEIEILLKVNELKFL